MEKQRLFAMTEIEQNMLEKALLDLGRAQTASMRRRVRQAPRRKLYLNQTEYDLAVRALNGLRDAYLAAGRYSDGIDAVILKLMKSRYRRVPTAISKVAPAILKVAFL